MNNSKKFRGASIWRILAIWMGWGILVFVLITLLKFEIEGSNEESIYGLIVLTGFLFALLVEFKLKGIPYLDYIKPKKQKEWGYLLYFIPLLIASIGMGWLSEFTLYNIAPDFLQDRNRWLEQNPIFNPKSDVGYMAVTFISVAVITPFVEEFLFRGIIFDKMRNRWSIATAAIVSSLIFGVLHVYILGSFVFGIVLCLLYVETNSLFVPIGIHFLNNFTAFLLSLI